MDLNRPDDEKEEEPFNPLEVVAARNSTKVIEAERQKLESFNNNNNNEQSSAAKTTAEEEEEEKKKQNIDNHDERDDAKKGGQQQQDDLDVMKLVAARVSGCGSSGGRAGADPAMTEERLELELLKLTAAVGSGNKNKEINHDDSPLQQQEATMAATTASPQLQLQLQQQMAMPPGAYSAAPGVELQRRSTPGTISDASTEQELMQRSDEEVGISTTEPINNDPNQGNHDENGGLSVANLVEDQPLPQDLPQAKHMDANTRGREAKTKFLLGIIVLQAIIIISLVVVVATTPRDSSNNDEQVVSTPTEMPTSSPSEAPANFEDSVLSLFPMETTVKVLEDTNSPQAKAFEWLLQEDYYDSLKSLSNARIIQKFVLATLFYATKGNSWNLKDSWLNHSVHECEWYNKPNYALKDTNPYPGFLAGFLEPPPMPCVHGIYQHLWLDQNNLEGNVPDELFMLTTLRTLSIGHNRLQGTISTLLGKLSSLEGFMVTKTGLTGAIPSEIGILTKLVHLSTFGVVGSVPPEIWKLTNLDTFSISRNHLFQSSIPSEIRNFKKMRWLVLDGCGLTGSIPTEIAEATSLELLSLHENELTGTIPEEMMELSKLQLVTLRKNSLEGTIPSWLGTFKSLYTVTLDANLLHGPIPSELGLLKRLSIGLLMDTNELTGTIPTELGLLSKLLRLTLHRNQLTGRIPTEFSQLTSMYSLVLANNSLSGTIPQELAALQQSLYSLKLEGNQLLSGSIPAGICNLNGTCISNAYKESGCNPDLTFDCSGLLCGCGACSCT